MGSLSVLTAAGCRQTSPDNSPLATSEYIVADSHFLCIILTHNLQVGSSVVAETSFDGETTGDEDVSLSGDYNVDCGSSFECDGDCEVDNLTDEGTSTSVSSIPGHTAN